MDTEILPSGENVIGCVYTPSEWAKWLISKYNIYSDWQSGKSVCDPTGGEGIFIISLLELAVESKVAIDDASLSRLGYIEIDQNAFKTFSAKLCNRFKIEISKLHAYCSDVIIDCPNEKFDILCGNPPWCNFTELPESYKEKIKPHFIKHGLVPNLRNVLLGSTRTDICALILNVTLGKLLKQRGKAYFYIPTSLFFGDDAHRGFREFKTMDRDFSIMNVYEFSTTKVFDGVGTAYCAASFSIDKQNDFPIEYFREMGGDWTNWHARPFKSATDPWRIMEAGSSFNLNISVNIALSQMPRQGVNTCGANDIFFFDEMPDEIPNKYIFPLTTSDVWKSNNSNPTPKKWVLLPYNQATGRPLSPSELLNEHGLHTYLSRHKEILLNRKGTLIQSAIKKGLWWSLLGVGTYSFAPYKIIWQSFGSKKFDPIILGDYENRLWQGNQSMNAFIPSWNKADAIRIRNELQNPDIQSALISLNGGGKCNWAQPGKIKKVLQVNEDHGKQLSIF